jgi:hypothetical protein
MLLREGFIVSDSMRQNIYLAIPNNYLVNLCKPLFFITKVHNFMKAVGFNFEEGLIHGNKGSGQILPTQGRNYFPFPSRL